MRSVGVPAPSICAPILISRSIRSPISGSRARIVELRLALGERCRHQDIFRAGDSDFLEDNMRAVQAAVAGRSRGHVAVLGGDLARPSVPAL